MIVHLHTVCWNELETLDFFFRNYDPWVDRYAILDDGSDDGGADYLAARENVAVSRLTKINPASWVDSARHIFNTAWKRSRGVADWVVVTNIDEHLHHDNMRDYLAEMLERGVTVVPALGYQMIVDTWPRPGSHLARDCPMGAAWGKMNRLAIFRPDQISETNFTHGRHRATFEGNVVLPDDEEVMNLHYKYLGLDRTHERHAAQQERLGELDRSSGWGHKYGWSKDVLGEDFGQFRARLVDTSDAAVRGRHGERRWWR